MVTTPFVHLTGRTSIASFLCILLAAAPHPGFTEGLPSPSRTVFKCSAEGKMVYSDSPCLGATKLEIEPTRGISKLSGRELVGADVRREQQREAFAEAVRPLTGMDAKQFDTQSRRMSLPAAAQQECRSLEQTISVAETEERQSVQPGLVEIQKRLFEMRLRFNRLRC
jgi:hypothetical protein